MTPLRRLLLGSGFRLTLMYTAAFMVSVAGIGWLTRASVHGAMETQARQRIEIEADALVDEFNHGGRVDLDAALAGRFTNPSVYYRYAVLDAAGRVDQRDPRLGPAHSGGEAVPPGLIHAVRILADGSRIIVADDLAEERAIEDILLQAFLVALGTAALLGLGTGLLLSGFLLRRLDAITRTAEAVVAGDLGHRIAMNGSGDEFDRLAATLNRMLDRIGGLLDNLRQVSSDIAHDLRTPLSRLRQGLESVDRRGATVDAYRGAVTRAITETDVILDIFSALLRIAQVEGGARRAAFRVVDLSSLLHTVADAYVAPVEESGRTLTAQIERDVLIYGDHDLLTQLFSNVIENGIQHTPVRSNLNCVLRVKDKIEIIIQDDGPGIPADQRSKVFQRFYQLEKSRVRGGHGLGLSLVAAIVDLHSGSIVLADNDPGLQIIITFPKYP
ncbi:HAMP domain-containing sensor histidine kinase [Methylobacterium oryzisoli]|uniref:HAMP domain-containing sensor histidine kinase n=1 Tax=Methylobacterium oryzisoli TaxID=3385502 RepID=UPI003892B448